MESPKGTESDMSQTGNEAVSLSTTATPTALSKPSSDVGIFSGAPSWSSRNTLISHRDSEQQLIESLLYCMLGATTPAILCELDSAGRATMTVSDAFDQPLRDLASEFMPLCANFHCVSRFVSSSRIENGHVRGALVDAVNNVLGDYYALLERLHHEQQAFTLSLQTIRLRVDSAFKIMDTLAKLCEKISEENLTGAKVLTLLAKEYRWYLGVKKLAELLKNLLSAASEPYFSMLNDWIRFGRFVDPFDEFMIEPKKVNQFSKFGKKMRKWRLNCAKCPEFLLSVVKEILNCGKYAEVANLTVPDFGKTLRQDLLRWTPEERFIEEINELNRELDRRLFDLFTDRYSLVKCLRSLKHSFLLDYGDWITDFFEICARHLVKDREKIDASFLNVQLKKAMNEKVIIPAVIDCMAVELSEYELTFVLMNLIGKELSEDNVLQSVEDLQRDRRHLCVYEVFQIAYDAQWPLSIVFEPMAMFKYGLLFRQLFVCKYVEWRLSRCISNRLLDKRDKLLLFRMHRSIQVYQQFVFNCLEQHWREFMSELQSPAMTFSRLLNLQRHFLDSSVQDCLLLTGSQIQNVSDLLYLVLHFAETISGQPVTPEVIDNYNDQFRQVSLRLAKQRSFVWHKMELDPN